MDLSPPPARTRLASLRLLLLPLGLSIGAIASCYAILGGPGLRSASAAAGLDVAAMLPRIVAAIILAAFIQVWLPHDVLTRWFGRSSGVRGLAVSGAVGSITVGGPMTSFPIIAGLSASGVEAGCIVAFLTGWSLLAVQRILVWELPLLGSDFVLVRIASCLALPILAGLLMRSLGEAKR